LIQHVRESRRQGATIAEAEVVWVEGMRLIDQRAGQFPGNGPVINDFFGIIEGDWRVYVGRPAIARGDTFAFAFNSHSGSITWGLRSGIRAHPTKLGGLALFNFTILYP
jgi:hypothetical protein